MSLSYFRELINDYVPAKTRVLITIAVECLDWVTDLILVTSLTELVEELPSFSPIDGYVWSKTKDGVSWSQKVENHCARFCKNSPEAVGACEQACLEPFRLENTTAVPLKLSCTEDHHYTEEFCSTGQIIFIRNFFLAGFALGTVGMFVTQRLRLRELKLLQLAETEQKDNFKAKAAPRRRSSIGGSQRKIVPLAPSNAVNEADSIYREIAMLEAARFGKIASLITLVLEDIITFIVQGVLITNTASHGITALSMAVLITSSVSSAIKLALISELPMVLSKLRELNETFVKKLQSEGLQHRRQSKIDKFDMERFSCHESLRFAYENQNAQQAGGGSPLNMQRIGSWSREGFSVGLEFYTEAMEEGQKIAAYLNENSEKLFFSDPHEYAQKFVQCTTAVTSCIKAMNKAWSSDENKILDNRAAAAASVELIKQAGLLVEKLRAHGETHRAAPNSVFNWIEPEEDHEEVVATLLSCQQADGDGSAKRSILWEGEEEHLSAATLLVQLEQFLQSMGFASTDSQTPTPRTNSSENFVDTLSSDGSSGEKFGLLQRPPDIELNLQDASRLGDLLKSLEGAKGSLRGEKLLKTYGVPKVTVNWAMKADWFTRHYAKFDRLKTSAFPSSNNFRENVQYLIVYLSSLDRKVLEDNWGWSGSEQVQVLLQLPPSPVTLNPNKY